MGFHIVQKIGKICNQITKKETANTKPYTVAIVLAAGRGSRMQNPEQTKQMMEIDGLPIVVRSLLAFESCPTIDEIMIVGVKEELEIYRDFKKKFGITKLKKAIQGADCRAQSAARGFYALPPQCEYLVLHDAARCLITPKDIEKVVAAGYRYGAAIAAKKATDTIKIANKNRFIESTPERALVWLAQTPQVFKKSIYEVSLAKNAKLDEKITDDAMMAENAGFHVRLVKCDDENFKITSPEDISLAKNTLRKRAEQNQSI